MDYRQTINDEDNAMEIEIDMTLDSPPAAMSDENRLSQASTIPLGDEIIQINILHDGTEQHYGTETQSVIGVSNSISPTLFQNENSNHSRSCSPSEVHVKDSSDSHGKKHHLRHNESDEDEGRLCPICLDNWTNTGDHRICSLKCGHLFGLSCINRWLAAETKKSCPTCKKKVNRHDIRHIYVKKLTAADATEIELLKNEVTLAVEEKNRLQIELTKAVCKEHLLKQQLNELNRTIQGLNAELNNRQKCFSCQTSQGLKSQGQNDIVRLYMEKSLELSKDGGCRVLDCKSNMDLVVTSMKSSNSFFAGYGVRKISISNYKPTAFIGLHKSPIRDLKFHPYNSWLLSASLDKVVKILDLNSNNQVATFTSTSPLWSCCWDADLSHFFYVGEQQGSVVKYDIRQMAQPINVLSVPGDTSAVVSIAAIKQELGLPVGFGGVIACKLNSMWIFENSPTEYTKHPLSIEGPFVSMSYQSSTRHLLVSARSNSRLPYARHLVCCISNQEGTVKCDTIHTFPAGSGQKLLSRSCILSSKIDYVAAHQENQKSVCIWSVNTGNKVYSIPAHEPVLDLCGLQISNAQFLLSLTERKLEFHKFSN